LGLLSALTGIFAGVEAVRRRGRRREEIVDPNNVAVSIQFRVLEVWRGREREEGCRRGALHGGRRGTRGLKPEGDGGDSV
jgi:hypothetical protein